MLVKSNERRKCKRRIQRRAKIAPGVTAAAYAAFLPRGRGPNWLSWFSRQRTVQAGQ
jgi:hypothetical protein